MELQTYNCYNNQSLLDVCFSIYSNFIYLDELLVLNPLYSLDTIFTGVEVITYKYRNIEIKKNIIKGSNLISF